jgi:hypothetical protein
MERIALFPHVGNRYCSEVPSGTNAAVVRCRSVLGLASISTFNRGLRLYAVTLILQYLFYLPLVEEMYKLSSFSNSYSIILTK